MSAVTLPAEITCRPPLAPLGVDLLRLLPIGAVVQAGGFTWTVIRIGQDAKGRPSPLFGDRGTYASMSALRSYGPVTLPNPAQGELF